MKLSILLGILAGGASLALADLATRYAPESAHRVSRTASFEVETTGIEMECNGEPVEGRGRMGGDSVRSSEVVYVDRVLAVADGAPTEVWREFETLEGDVTRFEQTVALESDAEGLVLSLTRDEDGEIAAAVEEGDASVELLGAQRLALPLDALLPRDDAESWDVDAEDLLHALGADAAPHLWNEIELEVGGRRGGGARSRSSGAGSLPDYLAGSDWSVSAELDPGTEEVDGLECRIVRIEASGDGTREGGGERMQIEIEYEVDLEATLAFAVEEARPVRLEVEARISIESVSEFSREDMTMRIARTQEGLLEQTVTVAAIDE